MRENKTEYLHIRVRVDEKNAWSSAAEKNGSGLSKWVRNVLNSALLDKKEGKQ